MGSELTDSVVKDTFSPDLRIEIPEDPRALIVYFLKHSVESILNRIILIFHQGVNTNKADFVKRPYRSQE